MTTSSGILPADEERERGVVAALLAGITPRTAFALFLVALFASIWIILATTQYPWLAAGPVIIYGGVLALGQWQDAAISGTEKDSPYFLGFILTMVALAKIFFDVGTHATDALTVSHVVSDAGAAILTTVAGLFFRQLLMSVERTPDPQDAFFKRIEHAMRSHTVEFEASQAHFVGLFADLVKTRERMFKREEVAFDRYIERLEYSAARLSQVEQQYPPAVERLLTAVDAVVKQLHDVADQSERQIAALPYALTTDVVAASRRLATSIDESGQGVVEARHRAEGQAVAVGVALEATIAALQRHAADLGTLGAKLPDATSGLARALEGVTAASGSARAELGALSTSVRASGDVLTQAVQVVRTDAVALGGIVEDRTKAMRAELTAVDDVIEELVQVLRKRLGSVGGAA